MLAIVLQRDKQQQRHTMDIRTSYPLQILVESFLTDISISTSLVGKHL